MFQGSFIDTGTTGPSQWDEFVPDIEAICPSVSGATWEITDELKMRDALKGLGAHHFIPPNSFRWILG